MRTSLSSSSNSLNMPPFRAKFRMAPHRRSAPAASSQELWQSQAVVVRGQTRRVPRLIHDFASLGTGFSRNLQPYTREVRFQFPGRFPKTARGPSYLILQTALSKPGLEDLVEGPAHVLSSMPVRPRYPSITLWFSFVV